MDHSFFPQNCIATGRGATAIFLALNSSDAQPESEVIVPANLCYAAVFPVLYAGMKPYFCDVDRSTGNVTAETFIEAFTENTVAAIIPHMYGNPVKDLPRIKEYCKLRQIILIEDCASAMGAEAPGYLLGTVGDYTVYSTGYSKTLDLGYGGLLCSEENSLSGIKETLSKLPYQTEKSEHELSLFSKIYRILRNNGNNAELEKAIYRTLPDCLKETFLCRLNEEKEQNLFYRLKELPQIIETRRIALKSYQDALKDYHTLFYPFGEGAVPWRFNPLVEPESRKRIIEACLSKGLPVSDWYPCVTKMFADEEDFPNAKWHEEHILNFPLLVEESIKNRIIQTLSEIL